MHQPRLFSSTVSATALAMSLLCMAPAQAIVPNDNFRPADIVDHEGGVNGVGMFYRSDDSACTGTLINPRTVLFAAHCVNDRPEGDYDTNGAIQSAFSFDVNAEPGFQNWLGNGRVSNPDLFVYNVSRINYDPRSLDRSVAKGYLEADIAVATLDTPATDIPTWVLLFSPLPTPDAIDPTDGTGYHVNITGYGRTGSGTEGANRGSNFRRRAAENMLGALASFQDGSALVFGTAYDDLPQNLYRLDFDDPDKSNAFDTNIWRDDALTREGTTASGDSGGPLVLDAANNDVSAEDLQIGVLSGGTLFFTRQRRFGYGTEAFYQPLYLYWDYIVATSPYRYVSANAGNGAWEDPNHWRVDLDPAFRIIDQNGAAVNGLPDSVGAGPAGDGPDFGEICGVYGDSVGTCSDLETGALVSTSTSAAGVAVASPELSLSVSSGDRSGSPDDSTAPDRNIALVSAAEIGRPELRLSVSAGDRNASLDGLPFESNGMTDASDPAAGATISTIGIATSVQATSAGSTNQTAMSAASAPQSLPAPTLENGLPGATGFVPDNSDPDPANDVNGRYFDVTLNQRGTTTLSSAVEVDRLSLIGRARLTIHPSGDLTVLTDYTQTNGTLRVNGRLTTGEALIMRGGLLGSGVFDPTFLTVVRGVIRPGERRAEALTIQGDVILSSGVRLMMDIGENKYDVLAVTGDADNSGTIALGGTLSLSSRGQQAPRDGQSFDIVTAEGGIDPTYNSFDRVRAQLGVLEPSLVYGSNAVTLNLTAGSLAANLVGGNRTARAFATALDSLRGRRYNNLYSLYGNIDVMDAASLTATLNSLAPTIVNEAQAVSIGQSDMMVDVVSDRLSMLGTRSHQTGTFSVVGAPEMLGVAASNANVSRASATQMSFAGRVISDGRTLGTLPENVSGFISGGYEARSSATRFGSRSDNQANWHIAMGLEVELADNLTVGGASAFINGRTTIQGSEARLQTNQAMAYASYQLGGGAYVAGMGSAAMTDIETARYASGSLETARFGNETRALNYMAGVETGMAIDIADGFTLTPRAAVRYSHSEMQGYREVGSEIALSIDDIREQRIEGRVGFAFGGETQIGDSWSLRPQISADYVRAIGQSERDMTVRFTEASGVPILLPGLAADNQWTEMRGGLSLERGNLSITTALEADIGRSELRDDRAVAELRLRF